MSTATSLSPSSSTTSHPPNATQSCSSHVPSGLDLLAHHYICGIDQGNPRPNFSACCIDDTVYDGTEYGNPYITGCISYCKADKTLSDFQQCLRERAGYNQTIIGDESFYCSGSLDKKYGDKKPNSSSRVKPIDKMSNFKAFVSVALISLALFCSSANAVVAEVCRDNGCSDCPVALEGNTPYPQCVIGDTSKLEGLDPPFTRVGDHLESWWNLQNFTPECKTIVRSPAAVDRPGCGDVVGAFANPTCAAIKLRDTFMVQSCCGVDQCNEATGYGRRGTNALFAGREILNRRGGFGGNAVLLKGRDGKVIPPIAVGYAPDYTGPRDEKIANGDIGAFMTLIENAPPRRSQQKQEAQVQQMTKRDCKAYKETAHFTTSGQTQIVSNVISGPGSIEASKSVTVGKSTSFETTAGDPFGIITQSIGFEFSEEKSVSVSHTLEVPDGTRAAMGFSPYLECTEGDLSDCDNGGPFHGTACTPQLNGDGSPQGEYDLVNMS